MIKRILPIICLLFVTFEPARADVNIGDKAPEITVDKWYNLPKGKKSVTKADLKGQIVVVEFWATWCGPCIASIPHLNEMQAKYKKDGVVLLAVSYEPTATVSKFLGSRKMNYVVAAGGETTRDAFGIDGYPTSFIIDPDGNVVWKGHPATIDEPLAKIVKETPAKGKSFLVSGSAKSLATKADKLYQKRDYEGAMKAYEQLSKDYSETKEGKTAKEKLKKMKGNSSIMEKIKSAKEERQADKWLRCARALAQYGDPADSVKYYKRIIDKYPNTKSAKFALSEYDAIKEKAGKSASKNDASSEKKSAKKSAEADGEDEDEDSDDDSDSDDSDDADEDSSDDE
ncbi:MAG: redoxin domain-containing protein [Phycisphaerae bacterium]|nr:redoxin domain-containing protein [Phycisphaerae bacterium]